MRKATIIPAALRTSGGISVSENQINKDLSDLEFQQILDYTIEELIEKACEEEWEIKHIEFWIKVKNAQNLEYIAKAMPVMA